MKPTGIGADPKLGSSKDQKRVERIFQEFLRHFRLDQVQDPWLEVGAGDNFLRQIIRERTGLTPHTSELDLDRQAYPFADQFFKTVTSFEVLEHLFNPLLHLREVYRVMQPQADLFLSTPNDYSLIYKAEHLLSRKYRPHFHQYSERDLKDILSLAGFETVSIWKFHRSATGTLARISRNGFLVQARKV